MVAYNTTAVRSNSNVTSYARIHTQNAPTVTKITSRNFQAVSSQSSIFIAQLMHVYNSLDKVANISVKLL